MCMHLARQDVQDVIVQCHKRQSSGTDRSDRSDGRQTDNNTHPCAGLGSNLALNLVRSIGYEAGAFDFGNI